MADDTAQTPLIDALEERVVVFRAQPEAKGFTQLRQELRDAGRGELLAELCATWAQHERDPVRAADAWSEAGEAMAVLGEQATAVEYLRAALNLDPSNDRASDRLLEIVEPTDPAAAVEIIEQELTELAKRAGAKGLGTIALTPEGIRSPIAKFLSASEIEAVTTRLGASEGDLVLLVADQPPVVAKTLSALR
nr:hypothetical protein [Deltaproteobacteria bacterium]